MAKGDELRKQGKYGEATLEYRRARAILDTPEIKQRQDDNEYDSLLASSKRDIEAENWKAAQGWLMTAQRIRNTAEVQRLLAQVNENLPKATPGD